MIKAVNGKKIILFLKSIAITIAVGGLSALLTRNSNDFYNALLLPSFAPPSYVFPIVWTILYILLGVSFYLARPLENKASWIFYLLLASLFLWPVIFFKFNQIGFSAIWIILCLVLSIITTLKFYEKNKKAGYLVIPLNIWIAFASVLNIAIYFMNK